MNACPKCNSNNIINLDTSDPPSLFECLLCNNRFHDLGFTPSKVDMEQSLSSNGQLFLNNFHLHNK